MKKNLLVLVGPTGIGKTSLSIELAKHYKGEIISADSMQIYKYMDIGTAKIKVSEMEGIPHHLIDIIYPDEEFTVSKYRDMAKKTIDTIHNTFKLPIIVGGTGLYINSLVYDLNFASVPPNQELRKRYEEVTRLKGNEYLHNKLNEIDKISSSKISVSDLKRIIRALEIYDLTGKTMSQYNKDFRKESEDYNLNMICLNMDRSQLYDRINNRVDKMINEGLVGEVESIINMGYDHKLVALQGIGYKEIIMYLQNRISMEVAIEMIKKASRNYAKRQLTWFRRDNRITWINIDGFLNLDDLIQYTIKNINFHTN